MTSPKQDNVDIPSAVPPQVIILDHNYDLTLRVGEPTAKHGQKLFRVSSSVLKLASKVWTAMLNGNFAEATMQEVKLPDDCAQAFHQVLRMTHLKGKELPSTMSLDDLVCLAKLCDKYDLGGMVGPHLIFKSWLSQYLHLDGLWKKAIPLLDCAFVAHAFELQKSANQLFVRLAMIAVADSANGTMIFHSKHGENRLSETVNNLIQDLRYSIMIDILAGCQNIINNTMHAGTCQHPHREQRVGLMLTRYHHIGLYKGAAPVFPYLGSVLHCWQGLRKIDATLQGGSYGSHGVCFENHLFRNMIHKILSKYIEAKVVKQWEDVKNELY